MGMMSQEDLEDLYVGLSQRFPISAHEHYKNDHNIEKTNLCKDVKRVDGNQVIHPLTLEEKALLWKANIVGVSVCILFSFLLGFWRHYAQL